MTKLVNLSDLRLGAHNDSVLVVQQALAKAVGLDFSSGPGIFGERTRLAYAKWQHQLGFSGAEADGLPGMESLKTLGARFGFKVRDQVAAPGKVASPVPGHSVTYRYGVQNARYAAGYHTGEDYASATGTPVVAVRSGSIQWSNDKGGAYGNWVGLQAENGRVYVYCHLSSRGVVTGQGVKAGQRLGKVGSSGNVTGPHLHFEDHPAGPFVYARTRKPMW
ncbi:peptidoglycan DD-metalloendopeptidase family protein [Streptomyces sp. NBC_01565]|uniref:peptidoglycan DD-metalloendopeptidase family protein n=1 Tax=unclassified Streptomyces TaxID=2593676 RepID=UPI0022558655|nr:peptidoglycan DD-metalloendopeptidase family protein [Streptomyces sp. NBC_01565]MCX4545702.1 peptidoglycan DD-metalloendopeptidase family protein [Streptomyces sp. NBC_01565]